MDKLKTYVDKRGKLTIAEVGQEILFEVRRAYWIYDVPMGENRGMHSNTECYEYIIAVSGGVDVVLEDIEGRQFYRLDSPEDGLVVPPDTWIELRGFTPGTVLMVLASDEYNTDCYINSYDEFLNYLNNKYIKENSVLPQQLSDNISEWRFSRYDASHQLEWDDFIMRSRNGTFIFLRNYMDYHSDRFIDYSLFCYRDNRLLAVMPAHYVEYKNGSVFMSHGGLTYGGFVISDHMTTVAMLELFDALTVYLAEHLPQVDKLIYRTIPSFYARRPSDEDLYALFRKGAILIERKVSSVLRPSQNVVFSKLRRRMVKKAGLNNLCIVNDSNFDLFWPILQKNLEERHHCQPVHSLNEIIKLHSYFPENIKLYRVLLPNRETCAGCVVYLSNHVAHVQYIGSSEIGRSVGALDFLFDYLIHDKYSEKDYFDFGVSVESGGKVLNEGLIFQKEGFGGSAMMYDTYELKLK